MNIREENLIIKPKQENRAILIIALFLLPVFAYRRFQQAEQHPGEWFYWFSLGFLILLWLLGIGAFIFRREFSETATLTLTPEGFRKDGNLYRWHEIKHFGIASTYTSCWSLVFNRKVIFWNYKPPSSHIATSQKVSKFILGYDDGIYSNYEIETEKIAQLLNDWRTRYVGLPSEILQGTRLDKKISIKTFFLGVGLTIVVIVIIALFAIYSNK